MTLATLWLACLGAFLTMCERATMDYDRMIA